MGIALEQHLNKTRANADQAINEWQESIKQRELAEKRRALSNSSPSFCGVIAGNWEELSSGAELSRRLGWAYITGVPGNQILDVAPRINRPK
jgi:hypothetical protein